MAVKGRKRFEKKIKILKQKVNNDYMLYRIFAFNNRKYLSRKNQISFT